jgi:glycosyltransferase involved in cell wall biosynthesis
MAEPRLSLVTCCKGRLQYLKRSLPTLVAQEESEVIVVDYDCPDNTKEWVATHFPEVRLVAVTNEPYFNLSRARNVGARHSRARWLAFCDVDQLLASSFASQILAMVSPGTYLRTLHDTQWGPRKQGVPLACEAKLFWAIGGYDDAFRGWGVEDRELVDRLERSGLREVVGSASLVETIRHSNEERRRYYEHEIELSLAINFYYRQIKHRYFQTRGRWFTDEQRYSTYSNVEQAVLDSLAQPESDTIFDIAVVGSDPLWVARLSASNVRSFLETKCRTLAGLTIT